MLFKRNSAEVHDAKEARAHARRLKYGNFVVAHHKLILLVAVLLLIPSLFGYANTRLNFDLLTYLPDSFETVEGQDILLEDFGKGAFSFIVVEGMDDADVKDLKEKIEDVPHVDTVLWSDSLTDLGIPKQAIPEKYYKAFNNDEDDCTMLAVFYDTSSSADETLQAVDQIREIGGDETFVAGMASLVTDLKHIAQREEPIYVLVAVLCSLLALLVLTDTWLAPFVFLASIGIAIMWNMGTNYFFGEVSYVTKALAAILQLAVTMDYSIFLWHGFVEQRRIYPNDAGKAMAEAIANTFVTLFSSMLTASAGFLALCFMTYTLGADLGIVMAKGCVLGFIGSITTLPALILLFHKPMERLSHRPLLRPAEKLAGHVTRRYWVFLIIFVVALIPAAYGFENKPLMYDFTKILTGNNIENLSADDIRFHTANEKLNDEFNVATTMMILADADLSHADAKAMLDKIDQIDGVKYVLGYDSFVGGQLPEQLLPDKLREVLKSNGHQLIVLNSEYRVSTDEVNAQVDQINAVLEEYDPDAMLIGEAPATKDLIATTDTDFKMVDYVAIGLILVILLFVFRSLILPFLLVLVIMLAVMINLGLPYYLDQPMVFIAPVCISTIQLGSTVNYAILMATRYRRERYAGAGKVGSVSIAMGHSFPSIVTSGVSFFSAVIGVSIYSNVELISSLCTFMARGALISTLCVLFILPAFLMLFDRLIVKTSQGFLRAGDDGSPRADYRPHAGSSTAGVVNAAAQKEGINPGISAEAGANVQACDMLAGADADAARGCADAARGSVGTGHAGVARGSVGAAHVDVARADAQAFSWMREKEPHGKQPRGWQKLLALRLFSLLGRGKVLQV